MSDIEIEVDDEIIETLKIKAELEGVSFDDLVRRLVIEASGIATPSVTSDGPER